MARLSDWGERRIVRELLRWYGSTGDAALGDDAAILPMDGYHLLVTTDVVNPATHLPPGATPERTGWYLVAVNLSDLAAMGGEPLGVLAALSLPRHYAVDYVRDLAQGMARCAATYGTSILGGDTKEAPELSLAGVAVGRTRGENVLRRTGCRPGDLLAVTGTLGGAAWALGEVRGDAPTDDAWDALLRPRPRLSEGLLLAAHPGTTACMDLSDGLAASLAQLQDLNDCAFSLDYAAIPADRHLEGTDPATRKEALLYEGGDFELLFTVDPTGWDRLTAAFQEAGSEVTAIGVVEAGTESILRTEGAEEALEARGYEHFR